jgi:hypothetical protein
MSAFYKTSNEHIDYAKQKNPKFLTFKNKNWLKGAYMCTLDQKCIPLADGLYNVTGGENKA